MQIAGLQKMSLLDYPGKIACTVFLPGCNFRCPFCHNFELLEQKPDEMSQEALLQFLSKRRGILEGVCITGGEPTLHKDLPELLRAIRSLGYAIKLDTNGYRPEVLKAVLEAGLVDYVAMDIKNGPEAYPATCGLERMDFFKIEESVKILLSGSVDYELRTTVVSPLHTDASVVQMAQWAQNLSVTRVKRWFLQPFVDRDTVPFAGLSAPDEATLARWQQILSAVAEQVSVRGTEG
jgi:pyruvate formate lyase activating enzyme